MIRLSRIRKHYLSPAKPMFLLILLFTLSSVADVEDSASGRGDCYCTIVSAVGASGASAVHLYAFSAAWGGRL